MWPKLAHIFEHLDAAVRLVSARDIRTPAGTANENYALAAS